MPFGKKPVQGPTEEFSYDRLKHLMPSENVSVIPGPIRSRTLLFQRLRYLPADIPTKEEHELQKQKARAQLLTPDMRLIAQAVLSAKLFLSEMEARGMGNLEDDNPLEFVSKDVNGVIHIGAHTGQEAAWYFASHIAQKVVHIECNPNMIPRLEENVKGFGHVAIQACLWNVAGEERDFFFTDR